MESALEAIRQAWRKTPPAADAPGKPMVLSGVVFLFRFLPIFFLLYFLTPKKAKNAVLLAGSLLFYAWGEPGLHCPYAVFHGIGLSAWHADREKQGEAESLFFLLSSLTINLVMLGFFEIQRCKSAASHRHLFLYFSTMSYVIDVYRGEVPARKIFCSLRFL